MMLSGLDARTALSEKDVLLVGAVTNADDAANKACRRGKEAGAYVVLFSPAFEEPKPPIAALCDAHVVNFSPVAGGAAPVAERRRAAADSSLFNLPAVWTWTGELIGSFTRKGKMPVIWESIMLPGSRERNGKYFAEDDASKRRFHKDLSVPPAASGRIGREYLDALRRQVGGLRGPALEQMAAAAGLMADCVRAGGTVHVEAVAHYTLYDIDLPGLPAWAKHPKRYPEPEEIAAAMKPGDVYFEIGYMALRLPFLNAVATAHGIVHRGALPRAGRDEGAAADDAPRRAVGLRRRGGQPARLRREDPAHLGRAPDRPLPGGDRQGGGAGGEVSGGTAEGIRGAK